MFQMEITKDMIIGELLDVKPEAAEILRGSDNWRRLPGLFDPLFSPKICACHKNTA